MKLEKYDILLMILFISTPLIDIINGLLKITNHSTDISIGQISRIIIIIILLGILFKEKYFVKKKLNILIVFIIIFFVSLLFQFFYNRELYSFLKEAIIVSKFMLIVIIIETVSFLGKNKLISKNIIGNIFLGMSIIVPLTLIIPYIFNWGTNVYSNGGGYKGFYYANNDLSIVLITLFIYCLHNMIFNKKKIFILLTLMTLISNIMIGSKTNLVMPIPIIIFYVAFAIKNNAINLNKKKVSIFIFILFLVLITCSFVFEDILRKTIDRQIHFMNDLDLTSYLFSNRNYYLSVAWEKFIDSKNIIYNFIFGAGFYTRSLEWGRGLLIEMDFFDTFFSYGILGTSFIYGYLINIFYKGCKNYYFGQVLYIVSFLAIFLFSFSAGHVLYSAFSGTIFALVCAKLKM